MGIRAEWTNGCAELVRPLGHAGLFLSFVCAGMSNHSVGHVVVSTMSMSLAVLSNLDVILLPAALYMLRHNFSFETIAIAMSLYCIETEDLIFSEIFAHAGHITLLSSPGVVAHSPAFLLACSVVTAYHIMKNNENLVLSVVLVVTAAASFVLNNAHGPLKDNRLWSDRSLWHCRNGKLTTVVVLAYCMALFTHKFPSTCTHTSSNDIVLHALHIGGIVAVILFIYPQVSNVCFPYIRGLLCTAATIDAGICISRMYWYPFDAIGLIRGMFSITTAFGVYRVEPLASNPTDGTPIQCMPVHVLRYLAVGAYIMISFTSQIGVTSTMSSFSYVSHICFIVGGLSIESIRSNDRITTRLTQILLASEFVGLISWSVYHQYALATRLIVDVVKIAVLLVALPTDLRSYEGVLSFNPNI